MAESRHSGISSALKEAEADSLPEASKLGRESLDLVHLCGPHHPLPLFSIQCFMTRVWSAHRPIDKQLGITEYIEYVMGGRILQMDSIARYSPRSHREWRNGGHVHIQYAKQHFLKAGEATVPSFYPFITQQAQKEHELLLAVHDAVPAYIPESHRPDICQDMVVAILEGKLKVQNLRDEAPEFVRRAFRQFPTKYGPLYLEMELSQEDEGYTLLDTLHEENVMGRW